MVWRVWLGVRPVPEGAVEPRGAAFLLRLTSPVHKEPRCPLVCLQNQSGETTNSGAISFAFRYPSSAAAAAAAALKKIIKLL